MPMTRARLLLWLIGGTGLLMLSGLVGAAALGAGLPVTEAIVRNGGQRRAVALGGGASTAIVVHRKEKWCQCPGVGVATQLPAASADSAVRLAVALFPLLAEEASREPEPRRCLTILVEQGSGRTWPWHVRPQVTLAWWRRTDGQWVAFQYRVPESARGAIRSEFLARWPQRPRVTDAAPGTPPSPPNDACCRQAQVR